MAERRQRLGKGRVGNVGNEKMGLENRKKGAEVKNLGRLEEIKVREAFSR